LKNKKVGVFWDTEQLKLLQFYNVFSIKYMQYLVYIAVRVNYGFVHFCNFLMTVQ